ncbi:MAG: tRNA pseudouridine(38-40) synthase TruA [Candidatus Eremiobacteraeota bacterium]|nr:tRNA pseudouridine(38-40) synthase TruA [Candidatus Eremiobacteraeota bacterium]
MGRSARSRREARRAAPHRESDRLTTLRLTVEYDGTEFCGFQWQPAMRTVAGELEAALSRLFDEPVNVVGAGRTDTGVHATGQVVSCATAAAFPFERLTLALNSTLPRDVTIREAAVVDAAFSARFSARERTYIYAILNRRTPSALLRRRAYHVWKPLDVGAMRLAAESLVGERDFRSFCGVLPESGVTVRTVRRLAMDRTGDTIRLEIAADGFLHHMVRTIVGTLVECGWGKRTPADVAAIVAARDRAAAGHNAPPHGLYLAGVRYDDYDSFAEPPISAGAGPSR